ncbi:MAG: hypothetical protein WB239_01955 [Acidimicrobiia bacterium]
MGKPKGGVIMKIFQKQPLHDPTRAVGHCDHPERYTTVNFGLERSVCTHCGDVTVRDLGHTGSGDLFKPAPARS